MKRLIRINAEKVIGLQRKDGLNPDEVAFVRNLKKTMVIPALSIATTANTAKAFNTTTNNSNDTVDGGDQGGTGAQKRKAEAAEGEPATKKRG